MRFETAALLFDIDGTLVDSTPVVERSWRAWASERRLDPDAVLRVCHGRRSADTVALFVPPAERRAAVADLDRRELEDLDGIVALPGSRRLLSRLAPDRWAAVTSGGRRLMRARLQAAGLPAPEVLVSGEDVTNGKPDPEGYLKAATALGWRIDRCLVIEDAPAGIDAARAAGAQVLAVATTHDPSRLGRAHAVIPDLAACSVEMTERGLVLEARAARGRRGGGSRTASRRDPERGF